MKQLVITLLLLSASILLHSQTSDDAQRAGEALMNEGKNLDALTEFKKAITLDKTTEGNGILYAYAGLCAENIDDKVSAKTYYKEAINRNFEEDIIYIKLAEICKTTKDFKCQEFAYSKAMIVFPDQEAQFGRKLAYTYYRGKNYPKLETLTTQLLKANPEDTKMMQFRATALQGQKKMKEAYVAYEELISKDPDNLAANIFLGNYLYQVGKNKISAETKKYESIKNPDRIQYNTFQKKLKIVTNEAYGKAIPYLEKANEQKENANIKKMLFAIYSKMGKKEKAAAFAPAK